MHTLSPFNFEDHLIRVISRDGDPWFVLSDVCAVLAIGNPSDAAARLDDDEKHTLDNVEGIADRRVQFLTIINESGLYSLILTSRKPEAKQFKKWVTAELLPTLRRTGTYTLPDTTPPTPAGGDPVVIVDFDVRKLAVATNAVRLTKDTFGIPQAKRMWAKLGMPDVEDSDPLGANIDEYLAAHADETTIGELARHLGLSADDINVRRRLERALRGRDWVRGDGFRDGIRQKVYRPRHAWYADPACY